MLYSSRPRRFRLCSPASIAALVAVATSPLAALPAYAQSAADAGAPPEPPRQSAVPRGASGANLVAPKEEAPPPPAPPPPVIVPPAITKDDGVAYPAEALKLGIKETVTVVLVLEIDPAGGVRKVTVDAPDPSHALFEEAAVAAAQKLVVSPATRNGTPVAAKIKHKYEFPVPAARVVGRVFAQSNGAPLQGATATLKDLAGNPRVATTDANGAWSADGVVAGTYHLDVTAAGFVAQSVDVEVTAGEEANVVLRLASEAAVAASGTKAADDDAEEVRVSGTRPPREVTRRTLEQRELSRIPGTNGDAIRAVQNLPGVARPPGIAGLLIVRGSAPNATNVFVDGTLIPIVYHFGGLSSVIPTEMLEKIDFYPGNFSAQYGRVTGGVIDVAVRDPNKDGKYHGLAQFDLIDGRIMAEGPIGNTGWNFAVAGRRSWVDVWLKPVLTAAGAGVTTAPVYYDYQALVQRNIGKNGNFRLMFFGSDDRLDILIKQANASDPAIGGGLGLHTGFWRAQARYKQRVGTDTELKIMGAIGKDVLEFNLGDNQLKLASYPITSRIELSQKVSTGVTANLGMDILYAPYDVFVRLPPIPRPGEPPAGPGLSQPPLETRDSSSTYRPGVYSEFEITPARGTRLVPGVRVDYAKDTKSWDVAPRFTARQDLTRGFPRTTLKGGVGVFFQPPQPQETNVVFGTPGLTSNRAIHYGLGGEQEITRHIEVSLEGFYKQLDNFVTTRVGNVANGRSFGLEMLLRYKPDARFFGWVAYTLSRSELRDTPGEQLRLTAFDQTHILTILGSYRLGRGWEIGGRFRLVSGNLTTPSTYGFLDENAGANLALNAYPLLSQRLPMFNQLDIRVDKLWDYKTWRLSAYLDVQNVYNAGNVEGVSYNYNYTRSTYATGLPILPSIGIRAEL